MLRVYVARGRLRGLRDALITQSGYWFFDRPFVRLLARSRAFTSVRFSP